MVLINRMQRILGAIVPSFALVVGFVACGGSPGVTGTSNSGAEDAAFDAAQVPPNDAAPPAMEAGDADAGPVVDANAPSDGGGLDATQAETGSLDAATADSFVPASHPAFPQVPNNGRVMSSPALVTIVASNDAPTDGSDTAAKLHAFSDVVPGSTVWAAVAKEYGLGSISSISHLTGPTLATGSYSTTQLTTYVTNLLGPDAGPLANGNTIYLLYLPSGATFTAVDSSDCGYHTHLDLSGDGLAVVRRCTTYADGETQLGQLTRTASHEIVEAATDPLAEGYTLGAVATTQRWNQSAWIAWVGSGQVELADLCEGTRIYEPLAGAPNGGWELQRMWSNAAAADGGDPCVPEVAQTYESVSVAQDWYAGAAGSTITIPITGWSAAPAPNWLVSTHTVSASAGFADAGIAVSTKAGVGTVASCNPFDATTNGGEGSVTVSVPAGAQSGDFVVLRIDSFHETACYPPLAEDDYHYWPVGIYVP